MLSWAFKALSSSFAFPKFSSIVRNNQPIPLHSWFWLKCSMPVTTQSCRALPSIDRFQVSTSEVFSHDFLLLPQSPAPLLHTQSTPSMSPLLHIFLLSRFCPLTPTPASSPTPICLQSVTLPPLLSSCPSTSRQGLSLDCYCTPNTYSAGARQWFEEWINIWSVWFQAAVTS